ncbi:MAG: hypothetical protein WCT49_05405 [Candidatus Paceibacterota bacterium]|jgi:uncharacterized protein (DUF983 family)|nr:hypothetical protein [Candidatus Paceibacterota bacterium]
MKKIKSGYLMLCPKCGGYEEGEFFMSHVCKKNAEQIKREYLNKGKNDMRLAFWLSFWGAFIAASLLGSGVYFIIGITGIFGIVFFEKRKMEQNKKEFEKAQPIIAKLLEE